jgi:hypothetical protein
MWAQLNSSKTNWTVNGWAPPASGTYTVLVKATDVYGNTNTQQSQVVVTVICTNLPPVRNARTGATYASLQAAYNAAVDGDTIQAQAVDISGNLTVDRDISITLWGGYTCDYSAYSGNMTVLVGSLQTMAGGGALTAGNIMLKAPLPDTTPPTYEVAWATATVGNTVTISGVADDAASGIQKVEVSTDRGQTWNLATGTRDWSYTWGASYRGTYTVWVKVTDNANNFTVSADTFTPTISCPSEPARIARTGTTYATIQAAYDAALPGDTIQVQALNLAENLIANQAKSVTLQGGYTCDYGSYTGNTTWIWGAVQTASGSGTLTIRNIVLKNQ